LHIHLERPNFGRDTKELYNRQRQLHSRGV
jgi:hypothetical protein